LILFATLGKSQTADFSTETKLVRIEVRAVDTQLKPIRNLTLADFSITENDQPRKPIAASQDELPLDLFLIVDVSGSMHGNVARVAQHAHQALTALKPNDRVALMSFNLKQKLRLNLTASLPEIEAAINELSSKKNFGGGTVINTPIYEAAKLLRQQSPKTNRRAILILTDGQGTKGTRSSKVLDELWESDITLNALVLPPTRLAKGLSIYRKVTSPYTIATDASISDLVKKTSGELMNMDDASQPLVEILERIRSRYTLFYQPLEAGDKERKVLVTFSPEGQQKNPGAKAIGRRQYSVP
jgi:VWFA-related protein